MSLMSRKTSQGLAIMTVKTNASCGGPSTRNLWRCPLYPSGGGPDIPGARYVIPGTKRYALGTWFLARKTQNSALSTRIAAAGRQPFRRLDPAAGIMVSPEQAAITPCSCVRSRARRTSSFVRSAQCFEPGTQYSALRSSTRSTGASSCVLSAERYRSTQVIVPEREMPTLFQF
jgi:hypothetical protein